MCEKEQKILDICNSFNVPMSLTEIEFLLPILFCRCHTNNLRYSEENPNRWSILQVGNVDTFQQGIQLGSCFNTKEFKSRQKLLVFEAKSVYHKADAWLMNFAIVFFEDGSCWTCTNLYDHWLDVGSSILIQCTKNRGKDFKPKTKIRLKAAILGLKHGSKDCKLNDF